MTTEPEIYRKGVAQSEDHTPVRVETRGRAFEEAGSDPFRPGAEIYSTRIERINPGHVGRDHAGIVVAGVRAHQRDFPSWRGDVASCSRAKRWAYPPSRRTRCFMALSIERVSGEPPSGVRRRISVSRHSSVAVDITSYQDGDLPRTGLPAQGYRTSDLFVINAVEFPGLDVRRDLRRRGSPRREGDRGAPSCHAQSGRSRLRRSGLVWRSIPSGAFTPKDPGVPILVRCIPGFRPPSLRCVGPRSSRPTAGAP
jgi:hypothetical protein